MTTTGVETRFREALDALVARVQQDRSILAAILGGSLSHDTVWARSDIDLLLVTIDDKKADTPHLTLDADGVHVHAILIPRAEFRRIADGALHNSFMHSFLAKGRLLYTHDETIADLFARLGAIGERDTALQLLAAGVEALGPIDKAHKWMITRGDLHYTSLWILYAASSLARIEILEHRRLADREVIPQALALNPAFFTQIYTDLLEQPKTRDSVQAALDAVDAYFGSRARRLFAPVIAHLRDVGEARSCTEIDDHFRRHVGVSHVSGACEYLAYEGLIGRASSPTKLTKRSNVEVEEMAFFALA